MDKARICNKCGKELSIEMFGINKNSKDGLNYRCKECNKQYYKENRDKEIKRKKSYRESNREKIALSDKIYCDNNKDKRYEQNRIWYKENPEKDRIKHQRRRSLKFQLPSTLTVEQWESIKQHYNNRCAYCGKELPLEQEHFIPLSKGGEYTINNIIPACKSCNSSKNDKDFFKWYPKHKHYAKKRERIILEFLGYGKDNKQQLALII